MASPLIEVLLMASTIAWLSHIRVIREPDNSDPQQAMAWRIA